MPCQVRARGEKFKLHHYQQFRMAPPRLVYVLRRGGHLTRGDEPSRQARPKPLPPIRAVRMDVRPPAKILGASLPCLEHVTPDGRGHGDESVDAETHREGVGRHLAAVAVRDEIHPLAARMLVAEP